MALDRHCKILKIYVREDSRYQGQSLYHAIVHRLAELGMAGATVTRAVEGFGHEKRIRSTGILDLSLKLPMVIEVIDTEAQIEKALPIVSEMVNEGLIAVVDATVIKYGNQLTADA